MYLGSILSRKKIHKYPKVTVECNSKISEGCSINTTISYRFLTKNLKKNNGVYICEFVLLILKVEIVLFANIKLRRWIFYKN